CANLPAMRTLLFATLLTVSAAAQAPPPPAAGAAPLGAFDGHTAVGAPKLAGAAAYNPLSQDYALAAAGTNMWAQRDEFEFVWKRLSGDFILQARVQFAGKGV